MNDLLSVIEEVEKMISEGKLDEAKEKVAKVMKEANIDLAKVLEEISSN
ncbi:MAG: hypothetical protein OEY33_03210 [Bdellovibrionales bacterium]|nr:hypothetical protein [Bdellovibrionales bacterium]